MRADTTMAEVCNRHGISQTTYYKWRDRLFAASDMIYSKGAFSR
ncbi:MAG: transposase, partial [Candidatus Zixiibacteriota bacterium]